MRQSNTFLQLAKGLLIAFRAIAKGNQIPFRANCMRNPRIACNADTDSNIPLGDLKGIVQPFELGGVTSLIQSAVKFCKAGH